MTRRLCLAIGLILLGCLPAMSQNNETEASASELPPFVLSPEAVAAGVDGKLQIGLSISAEGKASNIRIFGGPMWPCGAKEPKDVEEVRREVKKLLQSATFQPATRNGKAKSSDVQITFLLSRSFTDAQDSKTIEKNLKNGVAPSLVDVKDISRLAIDMPKQLGRIGNSPSYRLTEMQILVDEHGNVISAGGFRAAPIYLQEGRKLACSAKFKPLILANRPVKMTGTVMYGLY